MSAFLTNNNQLGLTAMAEDPEKQGIVSILCSDSARAPSLRRTLSADMSSNTWLSPMKRIASSDELSHHVNAGQLDIWSSIVSQNANHDSSAPYVHPLVKRSATSLSNNSLDLCTESLGSDGFSADLDENQKQHQPQNLESEEVHVVKYNFTPAGKNTPPTSFPPPLPSRGDGPSLRENGRLVLEAVSVAVENNFKAKRHDGRLVLTLLKDEQTDQRIVPEEKAHEELGEIEIVTRKEPKSSGGVIELHRLAMMMNKPATHNPTWAHKFNQVAKFDELKKSLPPRPLAGAC